MTTREAFGVPATHWLSELQQNSLIIPLGCAGLDDLLGGGMLSHEIMEVVGHSATGKTQLCMHCALHTAVTADEATIIYIDTGCSFSPQRMAEMFTSQLDPTQLRPQEMQEDFAGPKSPEEFLSHILSKIQCIQAFQAFQLLQVLQNIYEAMQEGTRPFYRSLRLIIIDSLAAVISPILGGKQSIAHSVMMQISRYMKALASEHQICILYTNYLVTGTFSDRKNYKPALGESWLSVPHTRLLLSSSELGHQKSLRAELVKSTSMPANKYVEFEISPAGIVPV